ncbi:hypothetical protein H0H81_004048 [Sphagnurus paluster]|uniref:Uncharacterized protein n=1 Tax=Sphagnurus paluster TaxID=117069 RepID=A0A9P7GM30_9AGAR|nr:hypothetical protein H0H81_004048 [Sphagnurus paluster]
MVVKISLTNKSVASLIIPLHHERIYGEALHSITLVSVDDTTPHPPFNFIELDQLYRTREDVLTWASGWGGLASWDVGLDLSRQRAIDEGHDALWKDEIVNHVHLGRRMLSRMQLLEENLPTEMWKHTSDSEDDGDYRSDNCGDDGDEEMSDEEDK